jgi:hypothetical protein
VLEAIFIDGVIKNQDFISFFEEGLEDGSFKNLFFGFSGKEVNIVLSRFSSANIFIERSKFGGVVSRVPSSQFGEFRSITRIFNNSEFDIFSKFGEKFIISFFGGLLFLLGSLFT